MVSSTFIGDELRKAPDPSQAGEKVRGRAAQTLRPPGALARLDDLAAWVAEWHDDPEPVVRRPVVIVFAGSHGVVDEGVSAFGSEVNQEMMNAFHLGSASISAIGRAVGAEVFAVDTGTDRATGNIKVEPALSSDRLTEAWSQGREAVTSRPADLLVLGEMGIGNTTAAAALTAALLLSPEERTRDAVSGFVGTGAGVSEEQLATKRDVVFEAVARVGETTDPVELLAELGGSELAAIAGALFEARMLGIPVLLDGYIASVPALVLHAIDAGFTGHLRAGHRSAEQGHSEILSTLGLEPLLDLGLRLGEGSGAAAAVPLVVMACRLVTEVPTFDEWFT